MSFTIYTFQSIAFTRELSGDEVSPWFDNEAQYTKDPVLGGSLTYLDIGALVAPPLSFRGNCVNATDRFNLKNALGSTGTFTSTTGPFSATATLVKATPVNVGNYRSWAIDLTFELRP